MDNPIKPSIEHIGIGLTVISAVAAFFGWIYSRARCFVVGIVEQGLSEHRRVDAVAIEAAQKGLAILEERTWNIMDGLSEVRDDIKVLLKMSGHNCNKERGDHCSFLDDAIEESHDRN